MGSGGETVFHRWDTQNPLNTPLNTLSTPSQHTSQHTSQYTVSTHPINPPYQHTLSTHISTHPLNTLYQPTLSTHPINPPYQPTLSSHPNNPHYQPTLSTHTNNPHYQPPLAGFEQVSFVNAVCTSRGGTHVQYIVSQITKSIEDMLAKKAPQFPAPSSNAIKNKFMVFIKCLIDNPAFDSQSKETLSTRPQGITPSHLHIP